jgi:hypothetical protein
MSQCKSFTMTMKWEMPPQTSSTHLLGQYAATSLSQDNTIKPHKASSQDKSLSMVSFRSMETTSVCTPLTTLMATLQLHRPLSMWTNHLRSETLKYWWPHLQNRTSLGHLDLQHHMSHTQAHYLLTLTITCAHRPLRSSKNPESYQETIGSAISRVSHWNTPTLSQGSEKEWWRLLSTDMISTLTTPNCFYREGITAPVTHVHSGQGKTCTPNGCSPTKKPIPSTLGRHSPLWSISPSSKNEMKLYEPKCNASETSMIESETWPKTWPTSRSCTMILGRRSTTLCAPWPALTPSTDSSHASSMMPQRP